MTPRTLALGDLHLSRHTHADVATDLARLLAAHAGARLVFCGDLFDLSADSPHAERRRALEAAFAEHPTIRTALGTHVERGGELWLVAGNHDAEVGEPAFVDTLARLLLLSPEARPRLRTSPWFFREGGLHLEHGHLYDPDNAPAHPLVAGEASLGVLFVEEFIAPTGAFAYLNSNDATPLKLLWSAFAWYGPRAPHVIYRYFHTAIVAMARSGAFYRAAHEREEGARRMQHFAESIGLPPEECERLIGLGPPPTLESLSRTFTRLYFDRVLATFALMGGASALALGRRTVGATALAAGATLMGVSWARGHDRYAGTVTQHLARGARAVADASGAALVVFGHTHREAIDDRYANTGSFAFPGKARGRPYLELEGGTAAPRAARRWLPRQ